MEQSVAPPPEAVRSGVGKTLFIVTVIVVAIIAFLGGLGVSSFIFPPRAKLIVGTNAPFPPFESYNDASGKFEGFDIDIMQLVADSLGRELVVRNFNDFGVLLQTVGSGGVDIAASAITMSGPAGATRNQTMSFSNPYYSANQAVVIRAGFSFTCPNSVCTATEIVNHTIGVQSQTTSEAWVDAEITPIQANPDTTIHRYPNVATEIDALRTSVYDLMIIDEAPARAIVSGSAGSLALAGVIVTNELYGFPVRRGDPKGLVPAINTVLAAIMADGRYDALLRKWFS
ncbi:MAG TPA: ABC transporter substrate-binding protein [Thermoplasmata archaeon]|nr:ABC transporter substrate-binding protein [Thermoplasmata archaeon]